MVCTSTKATSSDTPNRHKPGVKANHKPTLYNLVSQFRPINRVMLDAIANQYRIATGRLKVRDNVKHYFVQKYFNNNNKPTGLLLTHLRKSVKSYGVQFRIEYATDMGDIDNDI